ALGGDHVALAAVDPDDASGKQPVGGVGGEGVGPGVVPAVGSQRGGGRGGERTQGDGPSKERPRRPPAGVLRTAGGGGMREGQPVATEVDLTETWMRTAPVTVTVIGRHLLARVCVALRRSGTVARGHRMICGQ